MIDISRSSSSSLLVLVGLLLIAGIGIRFASSAEIQATSEWTLLGENDTIAAGMHARLDLEKGERWVKLPDDTDSKQPTSTTTHQHNATTMTAIATATDGTQTMAEDTTERNNDDSSQGLYQESHGMDFEMMHRTLTHLPLKEQQRIQLPDYVSKSDAQHRPNFEKQMTRLWNDRQGTDQPRVRRVACPPQNALAKRARAFCFSAK